MVRILFFLLLAGVPAWAHGGAFRPPPRQRPGDAFKPKPRGAPTTAGRSVGTPLQAWEYWWRLNREPFLRLRERVADRTVTSGTAVAEPFDRKKLREEVLLPVMLEAIRSDDEEVRTSAAVALGKFRSSTARPILLRVMQKDKIKQVREAAMLGLMLMRDPALAAEFKKISLNDRADRRMRVFAVLGLGFIGSGEALYLHEMLRGDIKLRGAGSTADEMRAAAALALGFAGGVAPLVSTAVDKRAHQNARGFAGSGLARLGSPLSEPEVLGLVKSTEANHLARYGAAIALGSVVPPERDRTIDEIGRSASRDRDRRLRALLLVSLGRIGGDRAARHIVAAERTNTRDRGFIYLSLGMSGSDGAGDVLIDMFGKIKNPSDRGACAIGLALAGEKKAAAMLRKQVERNNPGFVPHGMVALGLLDDPKAIPLVQEILKKSKDPLIRREGAIALALLRRAGAIPELVQLLRRSKSLFTRSAIAAALGLIGDHRAVDPLIDIYRNGKLQGEERAVALAALGRIGDPEDIPLLAQFAVDLNPYVPSDAISELLTIL